MWVNQVTKRLLHQGATTKSPIDGKEGSRKQPLMGKGWICLKAFLC